VVADATPGELRAMGGVPVIRYRPPAGAPRLPEALAAHADPETGALTLPSADVTADLAALVARARASRVDLTGLEVGPPSLEDAYLTLTGPEGALTGG
jgi:ABC-2 type transport system ATP-binding protein